MYKNFFISVFCLFYALSTISSLCASEAAQEHFITVQGAKLYCKTQGKGPPLLIIHGGPGLSHEYLQQLQKLSEVAFLLFYDQRGCGFSSAQISPETVNIDTYVQDIEMIRKAFHFDKMSILGHSWGGILAMHYAISHSDHVDKLILSNTMPAASEECLLFLQEYKRRTEPFQEEIHKIKSSKDFEEGSPEAFQAYYRLIFKTYCYNPEMAGTLSLVMTQDACRSGAQVAELIRTQVFMRPYSLYDALQKLDVSTLIIHGKNDPIPCGTAKKIHESIQGSEFVVLDECGHFPYVEKPDEYFAKLQRFFLHYTPRAN